MFCAKCGHALSGASFDVSDQTGVESCPNCGSEVGVQLIESDLDKRHGPEVFTFSRGSFTGGMRKYSIRCRGKTCRVSVHGLNGDFVDDSNTVSKTLIVEKVVKPIASLDWEEDYGSSFRYILDGYTWSIHLKLDEYRFDSRGYESFPGDYESVTSSLEDTLCRLIAFGGKRKGKYLVGKLGIWLRRTIERVLT